MRECGLASISFGQEMLKMRLQHKHLALSNLVATADLGDGRGNHMMGARHQPHPKTPCMNQPIWLAAVVLLDRPVSSVMP